MTATTVSFIYSDVQVEPIQDSEAVTVVREVPYEVIQYLNTNDTKGYKLDDDLDESGTNDADVKVNHTDTDAMQPTSTPSEQVSMSNLLSKLNKLIICLKKVEHNGITMSLRLNSLAYN